MKTCGDLIHNCVVVGHQKICPIIVVEPEPSVDVSTPDAAAAVKSAIIEGTTAFNARLFAHERITTPQCILFVPAGSLPRTSVGCILFFPYADADAPAPRLTRRRAMFGMCSSVFCLLRCSSTVSFVGERPLKNSSRQNSTRSTSRSSRCLFAEGCMREEATTYLYQR